MIELHLQQLETWEPGAVRVCIGDVIENAGTDFATKGPQLAWAKLQWRDYTESIVGTGGDTTVAFCEGDPNWQDVPLATSPDAAR